MKTKSFSLFFIASIIVALGVSSALARKWTSADGSRTFEGDLVKVVGEKVTIQRSNGKNMTFNTALLSAADLEFIAKQSAAAPAAAAASAAGTAEWPRWRGADFSDHSPDTGLMKKWPSGGPKRLWLYKDAGKGYAGPSIAGGKLFTMGARDAVTYVIALDAETGKEVWSAKVGALLRNGWGDGPRSTPTVDGDRVYALGGKGDLVCLKAEDGKEIWKAEMGDDFGGKTPGWGYCESVLIDGDQVVCTPGGKKGAIVALDKLTGKRKWQSEDLTDGAQYSSILPIEFDGKRQYVQLFQKTLAGVSSEDGKLLWRSDWNGRTAVIPTPIYKDGQIYIASGYGVGCKLVKLGDGEVEDVYKNNVIENHHGGVILVGDHLYGHSNSGGWKCQEFKSGDEVWSSDKLGKGAIHYADGMLYCLSEKDGTVALVEASKSGWNETGRFKLDPQTEIRSSKGKIWVHPVVVGGKLYLRDQDLIYCYDVKG